MDYRIDFHVHTNISDGSCTPKEVIELAAHENIKAIALTDHDSIEGINEASKAAKEKKIDFLSGIEISSLYKNNRILHILGIGINIENQEFQNAYMRMKKAREESIKYILKEIQKQGIHIDIKVLKEKALGKYLDRYDIYRYFVENNICNSAQEIWDKYLDPIPYGQGELIKIEETLNIIKKAGGLSFLAHYNKDIGLKGLSTEEMEKEIENLISLGLDGIERYYPSFNEADHNFLDYLIQKYNLMISGGTDFHGKNRPEINIGSGYNNNLFVPYSIYENVKKCICGIRN